MINGMKHALILLLITLPLQCIAQDDAATAKKEIEHFRQELNTEYKDPDKSPLDTKALKLFKQHDFFPVDLKYRVVAHLMITENTPFFQMKTTGDRLPQYRKFGLVHFTLDGIDYELPVYQSKDLMVRKEYEDYLFLPFTDFSNGKESYVGGRYLEVRMPKEGNEVIVDFNKAYNPYCAYSDRYSCPLVPPENHLDTVIKAGVRFLKEK
jgi:uncharacterized protein (DUF1684 family)